MNTETVTTHTAAGAQLPQPPVDHLLQAYRAQWRSDWIGAAAAASAALEADPRLVPAYLVRGLARRVTGDLDGAISDYSAVVADDLDPGCASAWEFRGASRTSLAINMPDGAARDAMLAAAEQDYRQAIRLDPQNDQPRLSMVETALITDRSTAALAHAGEAWGSLGSAKGRLIAAWLGSLAALAAGRPARAWAAYRRTLRLRDVRLERLSWCVIEVNGWLGRREKSMAACSDPVLREMLAVHELFLSHFEEGGPLLR